VEGDVKGSFSVMTKLTGWQELIIQWHAVQISASVDLQCSGVRVSTQAQHVYGLQLLSHCHVEQWSCTFIPPYTFTVWCLMTDTFPAMLL